MNSPFLKVRIEPDGGEMTVKGRLAWALRNLVDAGRRGCTAITHPGPRWSAYVYALRKLGFTIETEHEAHGGAFPGSHARYRLHSAVTVLHEEGLAR